LAENDGPTNSGVRRALHLAFSIQETLGGPPLSIVALWESLARAGCGVTLCTAEPIADWGATVAVDESLVRRRTFAGWVLDRPRFYFARGCLRLLRELAGLADVIHSNGAFTPLSHHTSVAAAEAAGCMGVEAQAYLRRSFRSEQQIERALTFYRRIASET